MYFRAQLEKDLSIEKNWRTHLQQDLSSKNELIQVSNLRLESLSEAETVNLFLMKYITL